MTMRDNIKPLKDETTNEGNKTFQSIKDTAEDIKSNVKNASETVGKTARQVSDSACEMTRSARTSASNVADVIAEEIRNKPVQSAFIALLVGAVGSWLFARRD